MNDLIISLAALIASLASVVAVATDRFRNVVASIVVLAAGFIPWLVFAPFRSLVGRSGPLWLTSVFGSAPLFIVAVILYGGAASEGKRTRASIASIVGVYAGGAFTVMLFGFLSGGE
jgi:hypothetical protein